MAIPSEEETASPTELISEEISLVISLVISEVSSLEMVEIASSNIINPP